MALFPPVDYSHLLSPEERERGYALRVQPMGPGAWWNAFAELHHPSGGALGDVAGQGFLMAPKKDPATGEVRPAHTVGPARFIDHSNEGRELYPVGGEHRSPHYHMGPRLLQAILAHRWNSRPLEARVRDLQAEHGQEQDPARKQHLAAQLVNADHELETGKPHPQMPPVRKAEGEPKRVALVVAERAGLVLFGKRRDNGRWTLPAGKLEPGEDPEAGARRELKEETGLEPIGDLRLVDEREVPGLKLYAYRCEVDGAPTGEGDPDRECDVWAFFDASGGIPKGVAGNMAGPKDPDKNVAAGVLGLEKAAGYDEHGNPIRGAHVDTDYSHLLSPEEREQGYELRTRERNQHDIARGRRGFTASAELLHPSAGDPSGHGLPKGLVTSQGFYPRKGEGPIVSSGFHVGGVVNHTLGEPYHGHMNRRLMQAIEAHQWNSRPLEQRVRDLQAEHGREQDPAKKDYIAQQLVNADHELESGAPHPEMPPVRKSDTRRVPFAKPTNTQEAGQDLGVKKLWNYSHLLPDELRPHYAMSVFRGRHYHDAAASTIVNVKRRNRSLTSKMAHVGGYSTGQSFRAHPYLDQMQLKDFSHAEPLENAMRQAAWVHDRNPEAMRYLQEAHAASQDPQNRKALEVHMVDLDHIQQTGRSHPDLAANPLPEGQYPDSGKPVAKAQEHDEVDRLLASPDPVERRLALKLGSVREPHVVRAVLQSVDPELQEQAFRHPALGRAGLLAVAQDPHLQHLHLAALRHPDFGREHLEALYGAHAERPAHEWGDLLEEVAQHPLLDAQLLERMHAGGHGSSAVENLHYPPAGLAELVEAHLADPIDSRKAQLARRALRHPALDPELAERAFAEGAPETKLAVVSGPHLPEATAQDVLQRGRLPAHAGEAYLRRALAASPRATQRHLETAAGDPDPEAQAVARARLGAFGKFEADLQAFLEPLAKATRPEDLKGLARAHDPAGKDVVDHAPDLERPVHPGDAQAYHQAILEGPEVRRTKLRRDPKAGDEMPGSSSKAVYRTPEGHPTHAGARWLVKPYHERISRWARAWQPYSHGGWAELTNQALYHAAGLGGEHQRVHAAEHDLGAGRAEPMTVTRVDPGWEMAGDLPYGIDPPEETRVKARKIALMDMLTGNLDRNHGNLLYRPQDGGVLAIDHTRSFGYRTAHAHKMAPRSQQPKEPIHDTFLGYHSGDSAIRKLDPFLACTPQGDQVTSYERDRETLRRYKPAFDWWGEASPRVKQAFQERLKLVRDPEVRAHLRRNFETRARWLDERAHFGLGNYGLFWYRDPIPVHRPGELSDAEAEERARAGAA